MTQVERANTRISLYYKLGGVFDFSDKDIYEKVMAMTDEQLLQEGQK